MKKQSNRATAKASNSGKSVRRTKRSVAESAVRTSAGKNGAKLETKEERERRLAKRVALTIRAFQMAYDNHHQK